MQKGEYIALCGILLGVIVGVPSLANILFSQSAAQVVFLSLLALVVLAGATILLWLYRSSPWSVVRNETVVTIKDADGRSATLRKRILLRSNRSKQRTFRHRNISLDGVLGDVTSSHSIASVGKEGGEHFFEVDFERDVGFLGKVETELVLPLSNCFCEAEENVVLQPDLPIKEAILRVEFPASRTAIMAEGYFETAGRRTLVESFHQGGRQIYWRYPSGFLGLKRGRYILHWRW